MMLVETQQTRERRELNTRERKGQDAIKISFASADSCIQFLASVNPILMTTPIEESTEEVDKTRFVG